MDDTYAQELKITNYREGRTDILQCVYIPADIGQRNAELGWSNVSKVAPFLVRLVSLRGAIRG